MEDKNAIQQENVRGKELASISYLWIFSAIILFAKRDNEFIQHHARRGFILFVLSVIFWLIPILHYGEFVILALAILGFISAAQGNENTIPVLSEIADGTLHVKRLKNYWHSAKHGIIKIIKPDHIMPVMQDEPKIQIKEKTDQERALESEKRMAETEEKKLSSLYSRINEDEKKIDKLEDEIGKLKEEMRKIKT